jgi:hypothetical protein
MIVDQLPFDEQTLIEALLTQQRLRRITIPSALTEPAHGWADAYDKQMAKAPSTHAPFTSYQAAISRVGAALGPAIRASGGDTTVTQ